MRLGITAFWAGIILLTQLPELPNTGWMLGLVLGLPLGLIRKFRLPACILAGFLWAFWHAHLSMTDRLPADLEGQDLLVSGTVVTIPRGDRIAQRFGFQINQATDSDSQAVAFEGKVKLSWYGPQSIPMAGERWRLRIRLKQPHGMVNPGGFDYEGWLFRNGYGAAGYVRKSDQNLRLGGAQGFQLIHNWRQRIANSIARTLDGRDSAGIVAALAVGERGNIKTEQWNLLTATGTNHLVAISGLHIGLVAGMVFFMGRRAWALSGKLCLRLPAPVAGAWVSLVAALVYAGLAGFSVPTQRALIMLAVVMGGIILRRPQNPTHGLAIALFLVLLIDPLAVLSPGFWLSFAAVAVLLYGLRGRPLARTDRLVWVKAQWVVALGLMPFLLLFFQQTSLISPIANLFAIPIVGFLVVPLVLTGTLLIELVPVVGGWLFGFAASLLDFTLTALDYLSAIPWAQWAQHAPVGWTLMPAFIGVAFLLAPRGIPGRWLGWVFVLPLLVVKPSGPADGQVWMDVLDVGQGLSVVVRTRDHTLLYDTGPRYGGAFDAGSAAVIPFLRAAGIRRLDMLVLSHGDSDHAGGLKSVVGGLQIGQILTGSPEKLAGFSPEICRSGRSWVWNQVLFEFIFPPDLNGRTGNHASCVLRVTSSRGRLLVPGDIESDEEAYIIATSPGALASDVLVVPHHGSTTSSTTEFVQAVGPGHAIVASGYRNRFRLPKPVVLERYREVGAQIWDTANAGAVSVRPGDDGFVLVGARERGMRFWHRF